SARGSALRGKARADASGPQALKNGAEPVPPQAELSKAVAAPVIKGIGDCMLYLVDRYDAKGTIPDPDYVYEEGVDLKPAGFGLTFIDHLTHNLYQGNMEIGRASCRERG